MVRKPLPKFHFSKEPDSNVPYMMADFSRLIEITLCSINTASRNWDTKEKFHRGFKTGPSSSPVCRLLKEGKVVWCYLASFFIK